MERDQGIIRASFVGIAGNVLLVIFKLIVGIAANSIAIILDAINNASDALSSIITIVGTKLAGRGADRKHPFGYGRIEYITSMVIAVIILAAGVVSARESIVKILHPAETDYSTITLIVIIVAILAKIFIGIYLGRAGKKYGSQALSASAVDSNYDAIVSAGTLVAALADMLCGINIDGIVGLLISVFVIKAGIDILRDALDPIIGERESDEFGQQLKEYASSFDGVLGVHDLILDNFGPSEIIGALHIEVDENMSAKKIDEISRAMSEGVYEKFNVILTIGIYATNNETEFLPIKEALNKAVDCHPEILEVHGFYVDKELNEINFDMVIDFKTDTASIKEEVLGKMQDAFPDYKYNVVIDKDYA